MTSRYYRLELLTLISLFALSSALAGPLHDAAERGDLDEVKRLIAEGANLNAIDDKLGGTPLHYAALRGHKAIAELLIAKGADVNASDHLGTTALHWTVIFDHLAVVKLLIANGADVNAKAVNGQTPRSLAIESGTKYGNKELADLFK